MNSKKNYTKGLEYKNIKDFNKKFSFFLQKSVLVKSVNVFPFLFVSYYYFFCEWAIMLPHRKYNPLIYPNCRAEAFRMERKLAKQEVLYEHYLV